MSDIGRDQVDFVNNAKAAGFEIIEPDAAGHQLLIDLDDGDIAMFEKRVRLLHEQEPLVSALYKQSKTPGHHHAIVTMQRRCTPLERQLYELMLGSDPCRAIHNLRHFKAKSPHPELLSTVKGPWKEFSFIVERTPERRADFEICF